MPTQNLPTVVMDDLYIEGKRIDQRTLTARRYRDVVADMAMQLGDLLSPSEAMLIRRAGTLAVLCERDEALILSGKTVDEENYRRNAQALKTTLISLGMAKKSRDVTKSDGRLFDAHAAAILDAE